MNTRPPDVPDSQAKSSQTSETTGNHPCPGSEKIDEGLLVEGSEASAEAVGHILLAAVIKELGLR